MPRPPTHPHAARPALIHAVQPMHGKKPSSSDGIADTAASDPTGSTPQQRPPSSSPFSTPPPLSPPPAPSTPRFSSISSSSSPTWTTSASKNNYSNSTTPKKKFKTGDFLLAVDVLPHELFSWREEGGSDLQTSITISLEEALHGFTREITALDGSMITVRCVLNVSEVISLPLPLLLQALLLLLLLLLMVVMVVLLWLVLF